MTGTRFKHRNHPRAGDLLRGVRLFRRFMGSRRPYVVGLVLLAVEAVTAVVEPWPIAYLVDFLQGAKPGLRQLGLPTLLASARYETILLLTVGDRADRGGQQRRGLVRGSLHGQRRPIVRLQHPGRDVLPACSGSRWPTTTSGAPVTC